MGSYLQQEDVISLHAIGEVWMAVIPLDFKHLPAFLSSLNVVGSKDDSQRFVASENEYSVCH